MIVAVLLMSALIRTASILMNNLRWSELSRNTAQLDPRMTLIMGQCFNWNKLPVSPSTGKKGPEMDIWVAIIEGRPIAIRSQDRVTSYAPLLKSGTDGDRASEGEGELHEFLESYFQLDHDLEELYSLWGQGCSRMKTVTTALPGVRVIRQEPWECLISFICSSNNNIKRITLMLDRLKRTYGNYVCSVVRASEDGDFKVVIDPNPPVIKTDPVPKDIDAGDSESNDVIHLFDFPSIESLAAADESDLRALGMGYRAKFIKGTAEKVLELGGVRWLRSLRTDSRPKVALAQEQYAETESEAGEEMEDISENGKVKNKDVKTKTRTKKKAQVQGNSAPLSHRLWVNEQLQLLPGVGRKVADCVAVFSLDQTESIPVDVHVWDIAVRDYAPDLQKALSLTPTIYETVGDLFRDRFKAKAGWAHSVLFAAELPGFKQMLPIEMQQEMDLFDAEQKRLRQEKRDEAKKRKQKGDAADLGDAKDVKATKQHK